MGNASEKYNDLGYFNLARGLGMLIIVFGHTMTLCFSKSTSAETSTLFAYAGTVLGGGIMAMFFMMSGFGFYTRSFRKCLSIQTKLLLKPYLLSALAILATKIILALIRRRSFLQHGGELFPTYLLGLNAEGGKTVFQVRIESISIFWFILALFGGWMIYNGIQRLQNRKLQFSLILLCVILGYALTCISSVWPFCLPHALLAAGYLAAGNEIKKRRLLNRKLPLWAWVILLAIILISTAFGKVNIITCTWQLGLLDVAGSFCVGFLLLRLYAKFMERNLHGKITHILENIGFYSIWILCLHGYEKVIVPWYRLVELFRDKPFTGLILCLFGRCIVIYLLYFLITRLGRCLRRRGG